MDIWVVADLGLLLVKVREHSIWAPMRIKNFLCLKKYLYKWYLWASMETECLIFTLF